MVISFFPQENGSNGNSSNAVLGPTTILSNGTWNANDYGVDGWNVVNVQVPQPNIGNGTIGLSSILNDWYIVPSMINSNLNALNRITVNVKPMYPEVVITPNMYANYNYNLFKRAPNTGNQFWNGIYINVVRPYVDSVELNASGWYYPENYGYDFFNAVYVNVQQGAQRVGRLDAYSNGTYYPANYNLDAFNRVEVYVNPQRNMGYLSITRPGTYNAYSYGYIGFTEVRVTGNLNNIMTTPFEITQSGTYDATDYNCSGFRIVNVDIPQVSRLGTKEITLNGTYDAWQVDGFDGYNKVIVNVPSELETLLIVNTEIGINGHFNGPIELLNGSRMVSNLARNFTAFNRQVNFPDSPEDYIEVFYNCTIFNQPLVLPASKKRLIRSLVNNCNAFNSPITFLFDRANEISTLVVYCNNFNQPISFPNNIDYMYNVFYHCDSFNQPLTIPMLVKSISNVVNSCNNFNSPITFPRQMRKSTGTLVSYCANFNQPITLYLNNGGSAGRPVYLCNNFNSPITVYGGQNFSYLYANLYNYNQPAVIPSAGIVLSGMYMNCFNLNRKVIAPPEISRAYSIYSNILTDSMFYGCRNLNQSIILPNGSASWSQAFCNCNNLAGPIVFPNAFFTNKDGYVLTASFQYALRNCNALTKVYFPSIPNKASPNFNGVVRYNNSVHLTLYMPAEYISTVENYPFIGNQYGYGVIYAFTDHTNTDRNVTIKAANRNFYNVLDQASVQFNNVWFETAGTSLSKRHFYNYAVTPQAIDNGYLYLSDNIYSNDYNHITDIGDINVRAVLPNSDPW